MNKFSVIIPARSGSKRVKDKNLLLFKNNTLIENTFIQSKKIQIYLKNIILSSDSQKYLDILKKNELLIKDLRPKKYALDSTKTEDLIDYLIKKYDGIIAENIILLQTTSPLRKVKDIIKCINLFNNHEKNIISGFLNDKKLIINGAIYIFNIKNFIKNKTLFDDNFIFFNMPKNRSLDIDTLNDYKMLKKYE